ncbi:MAG: hypothetical protein HZA50_16220, partial [Planctomycetes bacterium]|nr:hypothetical protein [Planctomycetota bacterium]
MKQKTSLAGIWVSVAAVFFLNGSFAISQETQKAQGENVSYSTFGAKIRSLDPATCGDTMSAGFQGNIFEGLYGYDYLARPSKVVPLLAQDMPEISKDGLTYHYNETSSGMMQHRSLYNLTPSLRNRLSLAFTWDCRARRLRFCVSV